ncbi:MAG TPA: TonB-dependent receptor [Candidatus Saccharimonadales bacterium]|nr:TonB-dependent receptor [Candidatus Saccharimonadales bacterium]
MRKWYHYVLFLLAFSVFCTSLAHAQTGRGTIAGTAKDAASSALASALIEVQPLGRKVASDDQGQFRITDVPAGEYTVTVSYVGFAPFSKTVKVEAGQTAELDALLNVATVSDQVIVTSERLQGEAEAINIERMSDEIVQVLPSRVITSLPNTNIADAVGRLPSVSLERDEGEGKYVQIRGTEPRLSNVTINGVNVPSPETNVRNIKLDVVPSDLVERIEVFKTLAANQDADGIGGTVNLVTKTAGERPTITLAGQGGYNPIQNGYGRGGIDGTIGRRFGSSKKLGALLSGTFDQTNRGIDDLEPSQTIMQDPQGNNVAVSNSADLRSYNYYRTRYGFAEGIDYNIKPGTNVYIKGLYSDFHDYGETWVYTPNSGNTIKAVNGPVITFDNAQDCAAVNLANPNANCSPGSYQYRHYVRRPDQQIYSFLTGARHDLSSTLITYEFAGSRSHNIGGQDFATTNFSGNQAVDLAVNQADPVRPKFVAQDGTNLYDATQYQVSNTSLTHYIAQQLNFQGAASLARRYNAHSHLGTFEIGLKIRNSHSTQSENDQLFNAGNNPFTLSSVVGTYTNPTYYDKFFQIGSAAYGPTSSYDRIIQSFLANQSNFSLDQANSFLRTQRAFFDANERVYAGYAQNVISLGKFRLQTGVRFEGTSTDFLTHQLDGTVLDANGNPTIRPVTQNTGYVNILPSVQLQYLLTPNTNLRGNFSQGISRPNIGDLVPTSLVDPNASGGPSVTVGNADLKPTKSNNYDILIEHYFQPLGILQGGYFYKQLSDPIYPTRSLIPAGQPNAGFFLFEPINGPSAHIQGIELAWEQRFSFLPGLLNGFGVAANYSYTQSRVVFPSTFDGGRIDNAPLQRQAPNTWNFNLTYDKSRFSMRFAISHNDANIAAYQFSHDPANPQNDRDPILGLKGPTGDQYFYAHTQFDIQGSFRVHKGWQFVASGLNLSNEVFGFYNGSTIYPVQREYYKPTVSFGFRWTSGAE